MAFASDGTETAGGVISNRAEATYRHDAGTDYSTYSPVVTMTIQAVASLSVTPDETAPSAAVGPQETLSRVFRICNTGNAPDSYTITNAEVNAPANLVYFYFDNDNTGTVSDADTLATINGSASSPLSPGTCLGVLAIVDTNDSPANSNLTIRLTARSNANGINGSPADDGTIINALGAGPRLTANGYQFTSAENCQRPRPGSCQHRKPVHLLDSFSQQRRCGGSRCRRH